MTIKRTITATCDESGCRAETVLPSATTQPFLDAVDLGWVILEDGESLLCPFHKPNQAVLDLPSLNGNDVESERVITALNLVAADFRASAVRVRPTGEENDHDDEIDDAVADTYDECAQRLLGVFGLKA